MQFLLRPDTILKAIPYVLGTATWDQHGDNPSPYALWHIGANGSYIPTHIWKLYAFFKDVEGEHVYCNTSNVNVQAPAVHPQKNPTDNKQTVILLHNLYYANTSVAVIMSDAVMMVNETRLFWDSNGNTPQLTTGSFADHVKLRNHVITVTLAPGELRLIQVTPIEESSGSQSDVVVEHTLYCNETVTPISGGMQPFMVGTSVSTFTANAFNAVSTRQGSIRYGTLKLSVSIRDDNATLNEMQVLVNGNVVAVDPVQQLISKKFVEQSTNTFFGTLRIPIAPQYFNVNANLTEVPSVVQSVAVRFPRAGGYISSILILVGTTTGESLGNEYGQVS